LILADTFEPDPYSRFQIADRALNTAVFQAEITRGFEEYLEIFDEFYADDQSNQRYSERADSWEEKAALTAPELVGPRSHNGRRRWGVDIHSRGRVSGRCGR
jgi:hypothetical protein